MDPERTIAVVNGARADHVLLEPVMEAIDGQENLRLKVLALPGTKRDQICISRAIESHFPSTSTISPCEPTEVGRKGDFMSLGQDILWLGGQFVTPPDVLLVLGDRIEAFAAAAAASVAGIRVAHMHGGDRAEGIADEALRHAITKLAHIHLPATKESADRIIRMGEDPHRVHVVGSPAIDGLNDIDPLDDNLYDELDRPDIVLLLHPTGRDDADEHADARRLIDLARDAGRILALHPNFDPGRTGILHAIEETPDLPHRPHLPRAHFIGLLRRARVLLGNSSAGLIECAALPAWAVNVGPRQNGREKPANVLDAPHWDFSAIEAALRRALSDPPPPYDGRYGHGDAGPRTAQLLASFPPDKHPLAKRNTY